MRFMPCPACDGAGIFEAPKDTVDNADDEVCEECHGSGNAICDRIFCTNTAVGFDDDGQVLCEECLEEVLYEQAEESYDE